MRVNKLEDCAYVIMKDDSWHNDKSVSLSAVHAKLYGKTLICCKTFLGSHGPVPVTFRVRQLHERKRLFALFVTDEVKRKHDRIITELKGSATFGRCIHAFSWFGAFKAFQKSVYSASTPVESHRVICAASEVNNTREILGLGWNTHAADKRCVACVLPMRDFLKELGLAQVKA